MLRNLEMDVAFYHRKDRGSMTARQVQSQRRFSRCFWPKQRGAKGQFLYCIIVAFVFSAPIECVQTATASRAPRDNSEQRWRGKYVNFEYGYALAVPRGLVGLSPPPPWPQHGIEIRLAQNQQSKILA